MQISRGYLKSNNVRFCQGCMRTRNKKVESIAVDEENLIVDEFHHRIASLHFN